MKYVPIAETNDAKSKSYHKYIYEPMMEIRGNDEKQLLELRPDPSKALRFSDRGKIQLGISSIWLLISKNYITWLNLFLSAGLTIAFLLMIVVVPVIALRDKKSDYPYPESMQKGIIKNSMTENDFRFCCSYSCFVFVIEQFSYKTQAVVHQLI